MLPHLKYIVTVEWSIWAFNGSNQESMSYLEYLRPLKEMMQPLPDPMVLLGDWNAMPETVLALTQQEILGLRNGLRGLFRIHFASISHSFRIG